MRHAVVSIAAGLIVALPSGASAAAEHAHAIAAPAAAVSTIGRPAPVARATRTIEVDMADTMRYTPARIVVREGEIVRFRVRNSGRLAHEFVLGTPAELDAHAAEMRTAAAAIDHDHMRGGHEPPHGGNAHHPGALTVAPGKTGTLAWQFTKAGEYRFACLVPGHAEAGMAGELVVQPK